MPNRTNAAAWNEDPESQDQPRSWTNAVSDLLAQDEDMFHQPGSRAAAASAPTTRLRAVPTRAAAPAAAPTTRARTAPRPAEAPEAWAGPAATRADSAPSVARSFADR